jgi:hypothetical protein
MQRGKVLQRKGLFSTSEMRGVALATAKTERHGGTVLRPTHPVLWGTSSQRTGGGGHRGVTQRRDKWSSC